MIKKIIILMSTALLSLFPLQSALAAGEMEIIWQKQFTSVVPIFMEGHAGDPERIAGFEIAGDILMNGAPMGTVEGQVLLNNPPLRPTEVYAGQFLQIKNTLPGFGTFEVTATTASLTSSTPGDVLISWCGSINNGTGDLTDMFGLASGIGSANINTGTAEATEVIRFRTGF